MQSTEVKAWVAAQDGFARRSIAAMPEHGDIGRSLAAIARVDAFGAPIHEGQRYFYTTFPAIGPTLTFDLVVRDGVAGSERRVLSAEQLARERQRVPRRVVPAPGGALVAYGLSRPGSEWETVVIRDVDRGQDLADSVTGVYRYSGLAWAKDGRRGFYYTRFPPSAEDSLSERVESGRIYYHGIGTPQAADSLIFAQPDHPAWVLVPTTTDDGRYLVITARVGVERRSRLYVADLTDAASSVRPVVADGDAFYTFIGNDGPALWLATDLGAPRGRIIAVDARAPARSAWRDLVPQGPDALDAWVGASAIGGRLLVAYRKDAILTAKVFDRRGVFLYHVRFPALGSVWSGVVGKTTEPDAFYVLQGVADPGTVYRLDILTGISHEFARPTLPYDPARLVTRQVFFTSRDGTRVPMFVVHRRDIPLDGRAPGWIYGYGSQNWTASPWFQPLIARWLLDGGVWAVPNLRGGGEYGETWHRAGIGRNKQNGIDDYIAAAEWLIQHHYTAASRLVAHSSSAGAVLVAAATVERPSLFAAAVHEYPVLDVLRYERFSAGSRWLEEYGTTDSSAHVRAMLRYAPIQNVREGVCYPATLVTPGEKDQTAAPMHAYKFEAALQHAQGCARRHPVLLRVSWGTGHGAGETVSDATENWTDQLTFVRSVVGLAR